MNLQLWLTTLLAAWLGVQGPLCAWACSADPVEPAPPCHQAAEQAAETAPESPPCDCEGHTQLGAAEVPSAPVVALAAAAVALPAPRRSVSTPAAVARARPLPPRDLLLMKASFLI